MVLVLALGALHGRIAIRHRAPRPPTTRSRRRCSTIGGSATEGDGVPDRFRDAWPYLLFDEAFPVSTSLVNAALDGATVANAASGSAAARAGGQTRGRGGLARNRRSGATHTGRPVLVRASHVDRRTARHRGSANPRCRSSARVRRRRDVVRHCDSQRRPIDERHPRRARRTRRYRWCRLAAWRISPTRRATESSRRRSSRRSSGPDHPENC